jgi:hypothetical protein
MDEMKKGLQLSCRPSLFAVCLSRDAKSLRYWLSGLVSFFSSAGRCGKFGCPGEGGGADGLSLTCGLNSLALTPSTLGFGAVSALTAPSAGNSLWIRFLALSIGVTVAVVAGLIPALASAALLISICLARAAAMTASSLARAAAAGDGVAAVVVTGLAGVVVVAGFAAAFVAGFVVAAAFVVAAGLVLAVGVAGLVVAVGAGLVVTVEAGLVAATVAAGFAGAGVAGFATVVPVWVRATAAGFGAE